MRASSETVIQGKKTYPECRRHCPTGWRPGWKDLKRQLNAETGPYVSKLFTPLLLCLPQLTAPSHLRQNKPAFPPYFLHSFLSPPSFLPFSSLFPFLLPSFLQLLLFRYLVTVKRKVASAWRYPSGAEKLGQVAQGGLCRPRMPGTHPLRQDWQNLCEIVLTNTRVVLVGGGIVDTWGASESREAAKHRDVITVIADGPCD